jgi:hypothetical protein
MKWVQRMFINTKQIAENIKQKLTFHSTYDAIDEAQKLRFIGSHPHFDQKLSLLLFSAELKYKIFFWYRAKMLNMLKFWLG